MGGCEDKLIHALAKVLEVDEGGRFAIWDDFFYACDLETEWDIQKRIKAKLFEINPRVHNALEEPIDE